MAIRSSSSRRARRPHAKRPEAPARRLRLRIEGVGHQGDGWAPDPQDAGRRIHFPFTVTGDVVEAEVRGGQGTVRTMIEAGPERTAPVCRHFGICGGCALQHVSRETQLEWKRDWVMRALAQRGLEDVPVRPVIAVPPGTRRRIKLKAVRRGGVIRFGFSERATHRIVEIEECPVLTPRLQAFAADPGDLARHIRRADFHVLETESGLDVDIEPFWTSGVERIWELAPWAEARGVIRLTSQGVEIVRTDAPVVRLSGVAVTPPPRAFLQPTAEGEAALAGLVREGVEGAKRVADIFAGLGTFTFALAREAAVLAVEADAASLEALTRGAAHAQGLKPITAERRDLERAPLTVKELNRFDALVFDPPRVGAAAQAATIAASNVPRVVAVSCNPATFARDARTLVDGGYRLHHVTPVDQFVWSAHIELVAVFEKI